MAQAKAFYDDVHQQGRVTRREMLDDGEVTYRQLIHWCKLGLLEYDDRLGGGNGGSGSVRTWPSREVRVAHLLGELSRAGLIVSSPLALSAVALCRDGGEGPVTDGPLTIWVSP